MILIRMALRNIFRHRGRSLITLSAIVFGGTAVIFVGGFYDNLFVSMREGFISSAGGHLKIHARGFKEEGRREPFKYLIADHEVLSAVVRTVPEVTQVVPQLTFHGLLSTGDRTAAFVGVGQVPPFIRYENLKEVQLKTKTEMARESRQRRRHGQFESVLFLEEGQGLMDSTPYSANVGKGLAHQLGAGVGDTLIGVTNSARGYINAIDVNVQGIITTASKEVDNVLVHMPLATAQELLQTSSVQTLMVRLTHTNATDRAAENIRAALFERGFETDIVPWHEESDFYHKTVAMFNKFYLVMLVILAVIVALSIFNTMNMSVLERTNEIGTVMALGTTPAGVLRMFLMEGFCVGVIGGLAGMAVGAGVTALAGHVGIVMPPPPGADLPWMSMPSLVPSAFAWAFGLAVGTAVISSAWPAWTASRLDPAEALRSVQ